MLQHILFSKLILNSVFVNSFTATLHYRLSPMMPFLLSLISKCSEFTKCMHCLFTGSPTAIYPSHQYVHQRVPDDAAEQWNMVALCYLDGPRCFEVDTNKTKCYCYWSWFGKELTSLPLCVCTICRFCYLLWLWYSQQCRSIVDQVWRLHSSLHNYRRAYGPREGSLPAQHHHQRRWWWFLRKWEVH